MLISRLASSHPVSNESKQSMVEIEQQLLQVLSWIWVAAAAGRLGAPAAARADTTRSFYHGNVHPILRKKKKRKRNMLATII